jgi:hypothetical protein
VHLPSLSARQLLLAVGVVLAIPACERSIVYVDRPGPMKYDTTIVVVPRPETSFVQLPGGVDTVITTRVDSLFIIKHDTLVRTDTVKHTDTVTIIVHDTVRVNRVPASICMYIRSANGDTIYLERKTALNACAPQPMAQTIIDAEGRADPDTLFVVLFDTLKMQLPATASPSRIPTTGGLLQRAPAPNRAPVPSLRVPKRSLILPGWGAAH